MAIDNAELILKKERQRAKIVEEILKTEETYQKQIHLIVNVFEEPLRLLRLIPDHVIVIIFSNIRQILSINNELFVHLKHMPIGKAFLQMGPFLKLYSMYANNHERALATLMDWEQRCPEFATFRRKQEELPEIQGLKLNALLITPVQRIPRYKLLLQDLLAHTERGHSDYSSIEEACGQIGAVAAHINNHIKQQDNSIRMVAIQRSLVGALAPRIITPGRLYIKDGILKKVNKRGGRAHERMFYLFSDILMYAKPRSLHLGGGSSGEHSSTYQCSCILPLQHCRVSRVLGQAQGHQQATLFTIQCKDESLLLFSDQKTVDSWINALTKAIGELVQNKQTLRKESSAKLPVRKGALLKYRKQQELQDPLNAKSRSPVVTKRRGGTENGSHGNCKDKTSRDSTRRSVWDRARENVRSFTARKRRKLEKAKSCEAELDGTIALEQSSVWLAPGNDTTLFGSHSPAESISDLTGNSMDTIINRDNPNKAVLQQTSNTNPATFLTSHLDNHPSLSPRFVPLKAANTPTQVHSTPNSCTEVGASKRVLGEEYSSTPVQKPGDSSSSPMGLLANSLTQSCIEDCSVIKPDDVSILKPNDVTDSNLATHAVSEDNTLTSFCSNTLTKNKFAKYEKTLSGNDPCLKHSVSATNHDSSSVIFFEKSDIPSVLSCNQLDSIQHSAQTQGEPTHLLDNNLVPGFGHTQRPPLLQSNRTSPMKGLSNYFTRSSFKLSKSNTADIHIPILKPTVNELLISSTDPNQVSRQMRVVLPKIDPVLSSVKSAPEFIRDKENAPPHDGNQSSDDDVESCDIVTSDKESMDFVTSYKESINVLTSDKESLNYVTSDTESCDSMMSYHDHHIVMNDPPIIWTPTGQAIRIEGCTMTCSDTEDLESLDGTDTDEVEFQIEHDDDESEAHKLTHLNEINNYESFVNLGENCAHLQFDFREENVAVDPCNSNRDSKIDTTLESEVADIVHNNENKDIEQMSQPANQLTTFEAPADSEKAQNKVNPDSISRTSSHSSMTSLPLSGSSHTDSQSTLYPESTAGDSDTSTVLQSSLDESRAEIDTEFCVKKGLSSTGDLLASVNQDLRESSTLRTSDELSRALKTTVGKHEYLQNGTALVDCNTSQCLNYVDMNTEHAYLESKSEHPEMYNTQASPGNNLIQNGSRLYANNANAPYGLTSPENENAPSLDVSPIESPLDPHTHSPHSLQASPIASSGEEADAVSLSTSMGEFNETSLREISRQYSAMLEQPLTASCGESKDHAETHPLSVHNGARMEHFFSSMSVKQYEREPYAALRNRNGGDVAHSGTDSGKTESLCRRPLRSVHNSCPSKRRGPRTSTLLHNVYAPLQPAQDTARKHGSTLPAKLNTSTDHLEIEGSSEVPDEHEQAFRIAHVLTKSPNPARMFTAPRPSSMYNNGCVLQ